MKKILLDVDTGTDDAQAIMMALARPDVELVAITCVSGNVEVDQVALNTLRVLEICKSLHVPVFKGPEKSILGEERMDSRFHHGADGMGGVQYTSTPDLTLIKTTPAPIAIRDLVNQFPGEITLVAVGPLTNVALALRLDHQLGKKLKSFVAMGGNIEGKGNITPAAEFNFYCDPEAAHTVLTQMDCSVQLLCWENAITHCALPWDWFNSLFTIDTPKGKFHKAINEFSAKRKVKQMKLPRYYACDPVAMAVALDDNVLLEADRQYCGVELRGQLTRGQMVVDWNGFLNKKPNVDLIRKVDLEKVKRFYEDMLK